MIMVVAYFGTETQMRTGTGKPHVILILVLVFVVRIRRIAAAGCFDLRRRGRLGLAGDRARGLLRRCRCRRRNHRIGVKWDGGCLRAIVVVPDLSVAIKFKSRK